MSIPDTTSSPTTESTTKGVAGYPAVEDPSIPHKTNWPIKESTTTKTGEYPIIPDKSNSPIIQISNENFMPDEAKDTRAGIDIGKQLPGLNLGLLSLTESEETHKYKILLFKAQEKIEKQKIKQERMLRAASEWRDLFFAIQQTIKSSFYVETQIEEWQYLKDYEIEFCISSDEGSNNIGVFKINTKYGFLALKIILRLIENTAEASKQMYRHSQVSKLDRSETSIPFAFFFPTIVPLINYFIGDLNTIDHLVIAEKQKLFEDTSSKILRKTTFLVMPLYDANLFSYWQCGNTEGRYFVIYQVLLTLEHFQNNRIVHGDLKFDNIFIFFADRTSDNYLKIGVGDFGLARSCTHTVFEESIITTYKEHVNQFYKPPELVKFLKIEKSDSMWDIFQGTDNWTVGQSILYLYLAVTGVQFLDLRTDLIDKALRFPATFENWLEMDGRRTSRSP